jgi:hypothetical protein
MIKLKDILREIRIESPLPVDSDSVLSLIYQINDSLFDIDDDINYQSPYNEHSEFMNILEKYGWTYKGEDFLDEFVKSLSKMNLYNLYKDLKSYQHEFHLNEIKVEKPKQITAKEVWNYISSITHIIKEDFGKYDNILNSYGYYKSTIDNVPKWLKTLLPVHLSHMYKDLKNEFGEEINEIKVEKPQTPRRLIGPNIDTTNINKFIKKNGSKWLSFN